MFEYIRMFVEVVCGSLLSSAEGRRPSSERHGVQRGGGLSGFTVTLMVCVCSSAQLHGEQPSYLKGDNFFKFMCCDCSEDGKESFERMRLTWQQVRTQRLPR